MDLREPLCRVGFAQDFRKKLVQYQVPCSRSCSPSAKLLRDPRPTMMRSTFTLAELESCSVILVSCSMTWQNHLFVFIGLAAALVAACIVCSTRGDLALTIRRWAWSAFTPLVLLGCSVSSWDAAQLSLGCKAVAVQRLCRVIVAFTCSAFQMFSLILQQFVALRFLACHLHFSSLLEQQLYFVLRFLP